MKRFVKPWGKLLGFNPFPPPPLYQKESTFLSDKFWLKGTVSQYKQLPEIKCKIKS